MQRIIRLLVCLFMTFGAAMALAQAPNPLPVQGNLSSIIGNGQQYAGVSIQLQNCASPVSIAGYSVIVQQGYQVMANGAGLVNTTVWPNDLITCNGTTGNSQYQLSYTANGAVQGTPQCYQVISTQGTWNLNTQQPITCGQSPPNPQDAQYRNLNLTGPITGTSATFSGTVAAGTVMAGAMNGICIASNQHTTNAGTDIAACISALGGSAGLVDATGYKGNQTIAGLSVATPVHIKLGAANFNVTGVINATNINPIGDGNTFTLEGVSGTVLTGNTGPRNPVIDLMGTSGAKIRNLSILAGTDCPGASSTSNPSTIGILQARTAANMNAGWRTHISDVGICVGSSTASVNAATNQAFSTSATTTSGSNILSATIVPLQMYAGEFISGTGIPSGTTIVSLTDTTIVMSNAATSSGSITLTGYAGSLGIYNYGAEVVNYQNLTIIASVPLTLTAINIFGVTPPDVSYYTGGVTMESVEVGGKSDFYGGNACAVIIGAGNTKFDVGECDGTATPGTYGIIVGGHNNNLSISGEFENFPRAIYQGGISVNSEFDFTCAECMSAAAWTGTISTMLSSTTATPSSMAGIAMGDVLTTANVPRGTTVTGIGASTITLSAAATATASGTSATMMEPVIVFDGNAVYDGTPVTITGSTYKILTATSAAETYYAEAWGSQFANSTGWKMYLPPGGNLQFGTTATGDIYVPALGSHSAPLIDGNILGYIHDASGNTYLNSVDIGSAGTYYPVMVSSEGVATPAYSESNFSFNPTTGIVTVPGLSSTSGLSGGGTISTYTLGSTTVVGTGATTPTCLAGHVCDQFSGAFSFITGSGTSVGGVIVTVTLPYTRTNVPNCVPYAVDNNSGVSLAVTIDATTTTVTFEYYASALTASHTYKFSYVCGGI